MPPPPKAGFKPVPARSPNDHRLYKMKMAQELADKMLAEKDPVRQRQMEDELGLRDPHHYDVPAQPGWPLHNWPYKGPEFTKDSIPESHFIARRHLPPEECTYARPSFALRKYECLHDFKGINLKFNVRRRVSFCVWMIAFPWVLWQMAKFQHWTRDVRAGRIPQDMSIYRLTTKKLQDIVKRQR